MTRVFGRIAVVAVAVVGIAMVTPTSISQIGDLDIASIVSDTALVDILSLFGSEDLQAKVTTFKVEL